MNAPASHAPKSKSTGPIESCCLKPISVVRKNKTAVRIPTLLTIQPAAGIRIHRIPITIIRNPTHFHPIFQDVFEGLITISATLSRAPSRPLSVSPTRSGECRSPDATIWFLKYIDHAYIFLKKRNFFTIFSLRFPEKGLFFAKIQRIKNGVNIVVVNTPTAFW